MRRNDRRNWNVVTTHEANRKFAARKNQDIDEDTAEQVWHHCRKELIEIIKGYDYSEDIQLPASSGQDMVESDSRLLKKRILQKTLTDLPIHSKQTLLNCLDKEVIQSQTSRRNSALINWYKLFLDWSIVPRRFLQRKKNAPKQKDTPGKATTVTARLAGVPNPPEPSSSPTTSKPTTVTARLASELVPSDDGTSSEASKDPTDVTTSGTPPSLFEAFALRQIEKTLEQLKTNEAESPAPSPSPTKNKDSPSPSPTINENSPSPSPTERGNSPAPSPQKRSKSPAPSPSEKSKSPAPSPSPSPSGTSEAPEPSPIEESESPETTTTTPQSKKHVAKPSKLSKYKTSVVAGCSVTGVVVVAFVLFCGVSRRKRNELIYGQPDEKPFHFSADSLQMPNGVVKSSKTGYNSSASGSNFNTGSGVPRASGDGKLPLPPGKAAAHLARKAPPPTPTPSPPTTTPPPPPPPPPRPPPAAAAPAAPVAPEPPEPKAPPPPKVAKPPPQPPKPSPLGPKSRRLNSTNTDEASDDQKAKLKPFFWDKVAAKPDQSMVWHDLISGSFQYNEAMMENLFGYKSAQQNKCDRRNEPVAFQATKFIQIIDPRKAQNLSIILKALNMTTDEVCDALLEGNELPSELVQTLLKMAPTADEELKLRLYSEDVSELGPAERFLKAVVEIPFAFKRLESLLFMYTVEEDISSAIKSFKDIEVACNEIKKSRLFLKLLEAVLKTGNRMNDGTYRGGAKAFKLDTLLKLSDVKGTDGKTTLLHFVVLEIIRSEGIRAARKEKASKSITDVTTEDMLNRSPNETAEYIRSLGIEIVSNLSNELENVKKAAHVDGDVLKSSVLKFERSLTKSKEFLNNEMNGSDEKGKFRERLASFVQKVEVDISWLLEEEKKMTSLIQSTADYFHGNAGKDEGLHLFVVVRDFMTMVEKVVNEIKKTTTKTTKKMPPAASSPAQESKEPLSPTTNSLQQRLFPAIKQQRRNDSSSSDDES
ncbi:hypothetical protein AgCh_007250 [Apium graveolens]